MTNNYRNICKPALGACFAQTGDEIKGQYEDCTTGRKQGTKRVFMPQFESHGSFTSVFLFAFSAPSLLLKLFIMSSFVKIKSCKYSELIPSCIKQYQFSLKTATVKLRMKQGLHGQTRTQRQGDFKDNSIISKKKDASYAYL